MVDNPNEIVAFIQEHRQLHQELTVTLTGLRRDVIGLEQYLKGNGRLTIAVEKQRVRFAGSLSVKALGLFGSTSTGGVVYLIGKAMGAW